MAGRHLRRAPRGKTTTAAVTVLLLVLAGVAGVFVYRVTRDHSKPAVPVASASCDEVAVSVLVDPAISSAIHAIADNWTGTRPLVDGKCVRVDISETDSPTATLSLSQLNAKLPSLWIPNSRLWASRLAAQAADPSGPVSKMQVGDSLATSPVVLAVPPGKAAALAPVVKARGLAAAVAATQVTVADPAATTDGLLAMLALQAQLGRPDGTPTQQLVAAIVSIAPATVLLPADGLTALAQHPATAPALITTEQAVAAANRGAPTPFVTALYPGVPTPVMDFPRVRFPGGADDQATADATDAFVQQLATPFAADSLGGLGLRNAAGDPLSGKNLVAGLAAARLVPTAPSTSGRVDTALREWSGASQDSRTLVVIDVSGSMADPAGNGQSKIQLTLAASTTALNFFPDTSSLGLWIFSQDLTPTKQDWLELVPVGPLGGTVGNVPRRVALRQAVSSIASRVHGNTGLYDTALAAYQSAVAGYDAAKSNSVVLLTDGANVDDTGLTLPALLAGLKAASDPGRPVRIVTVGMGNQADAAALRAISDATGGPSYIVRNPADIKGVFLDAVLKRK
jgi:Ca-activated chloride channel homolog